MLWNCLLYLWAAFALKNKSNHNGFYQATNWTLLLRMNSKRWTNIKSRSLFCYVFYNKFQHFILFRLVRKVHCWGLDCPYPCDTDDSAVLQGNQGHISALTMPQYSSWCVLDHLSMWFEQLDWTFSLLCIHSWTFPRPLWGFGWTQRSVLVYVCGQTRERERERERESIVPLILTV